MGQTSAHSISDVCNGKQTNFQIYVTVDFWILSNKSGSKYVMRFRTKFTHLMSPTVTCTTGALPWP